MVARLLSTYVICTSVGGECGSAGEGMYQWANSRAHKMFPICISAFYSINTWSSGCDTWTNLPQTTQHTVFICSCC